MSSAFVNRSLARREEYSPEMPEYGNISRMNKILILTSDALFRAKLHRQLRGAGTRVIWTAAPEKVEGYLASSEIALLIVDAEPFHEYLHGWLPRWSGTRGTKFIVTGNDLPERAPAAMRVPETDYRVIAKEHLAVIARDVIGCFQPGLFKVPEPPEAVGAGDRRAADRAVKSLRIFISPDDQPYSSGIKSRTVDISSWGARVVTGGPLSPRSKLSLMILLPSFSEFVPLKARVIWSLPVPETRHFISGLFFDRFEGASRFNLRDFLAKNNQ